MKIFDPVLKDVDYVDIFIDGHRVSRSIYLLYLTVFRTIVDGSTLWKHYTDKVDLDHIITAIAVKDGTKEVLFERKLSYKTLQWFYEMRVKEKLFHNTWYGMASM